MSWQPLARESTAATQQAIEDLLGLSRATFRASTFLAQGDGAAFSEAAPRDRKAILAEILGLDLWDRLLDKARAELRVVEHEIAGAAATVARLKDTVAQRAACTDDRDRSLQLRNDASELVADADERLEHAQQTLTVVAATQERVLARKAEVEAARTTHASADEKLRQAITAAGLVDDIRIALEEVTADAARIPALEQQLATLQEDARAAVDARRRRNELASQVEQREIVRQRLVDQAVALHEAASDARAKADHLDAHIGEASECDRCGQLLGAEAAARAATSYREEALGLIRQAADLGAGNEAELAAISGLREQLAAIEIPGALEDPQPVERELAAARQAAEKRGQLQERRDRLEETAARRADLELEAAGALLEVDRRQTALDEAVGQIGDLPAAEQAVQSARASARDARATLERHAAELARAEQRLEQIIAAQAELDQLRAATADLHERVDLLKLAERAYGRDGIPALIVESSAIPTIEMEANRILEMMPTAKGETLRVELHTQRALKSSETLKETLDIVVYGAKGARPYETFSGGEKARLNISLRLALAGLLAHRRGADSRLLAIDEIEYLDERGQEDLLNVIQSVTGTFDRVILVSHHPNLRHAFDATIEVEVDADGRSMIRVDRADEVLA